MKFEIKTERLLLRQIEFADCDRLFHLMSDKNLTKFLTWEPHDNIETTISVVKNLLDAQINDKGYHWCVCKENEIVGLVSLIDIKRKIRTWTLNRAELSYWIGSQYKGNGYATEACKNIIEFGFRNLSLHKIIVAHAHENTESERICTKLNFYKYAYEHDAFLKNDCWYDLVWYELINSKNEN